jgi:hypothetical protein
MTLHLTGPALRFYENITFLEAGPASERSRSAAESLTVNEKALFRVLNPPATTAELTILRTVCGSLPLSYLDFLAQCNGAESGVHDEGGDCLAIWSSKEIPELNEAYQIARWVPELLAIGSDGGGDAIGVDRAASPDPELWPVVRIGFGNLDRADFVRLASGFQEWQHREFRLDA